MDNAHDNFLYHYTSFETLALILSNRTICFNSLINVDDMEEAETKDMHDFGKYVYVSCWTDDSTESIALWNMYTPNMHGVRIGMPRFPFKKYTFRKGEYFLTEDVETYINYEKLYNDNKSSITTDQPILTMVEYNNEDELVIPNIKTADPPNAVEIFLNAKSMQEVVETKLIYSLQDLGKYKRKVWEFQKEWRYIITMAPMGLQELNPLSFQKQQEYIRRLDNIETEAPYDRFFLELDDNAVAQMEITFGPRMNEAEKIYVKSLLNEHGLEHNWKESNLKIR